MYFKLVVYTKLFFLTLKQKGQITEYIENVNSPVISECWGEGRVQSFQTGAHNLNQNGKWALNPINIVSQENRFPKCKITPLKVPFSLQQANNILEHIQLNKKGRIRNHTISSFIFRAWLQTWTFLSGLCCKKILNQVTGSKLHIF